MRKIQTIGFIALFIVFSAYGSPDAQVAGLCVNCHTMHNSQNGSPVNPDGPFPQLLNAECIACHTQDEPGQGATNNFPAPIVYHTEPPGGQGGIFTLAGGDFYWVAQGPQNDALGHNVAGISAQDSLIGPNLGYTPPGWDRTATTNFTFGEVAGGEVSWGSQLTCDGVYGCHGRHEATGITGAHHANTGGTSNQCNVADTVGNSYRFLGGIMGLENVDWNWNEAIDDHNEYFGVDSPAGRVDQTPNPPYPSTATISFSCAECHGYFHSWIDDSATGSPWLRHPTDIALPATGEYADYNPDNTNQYSLEAPIARPTVPAEDSLTVTPGTDVIMCLSCHRAHGSPEPDLLRWTYNMVAGSGGPHDGCFICHTEKNDVIQ